MSIQLVPAYLLEGSQENVAHKVELFLQNIFCTHTQGQSQLSLCYCKDCRLIKSGQHHSVVWLTPNGVYTNKDLTVIFDKIKFSLEPNQHFFFVVPDAHLLSSTTANRLLKSVEEPTPGFHFIFTTHNALGVLDTIKSRCIVQHAHVEQNNEYKELIDLYLESASYDPFNVDKVLKSYQLSHMQAHDVAHTILLSLYATQKKLLLASKTNEQLDRACSIVAQHIKRLPQSGSANLFLKTLYLSLPALQLNELS